MNRLTVSNSSRKAADKFTDWQPDAVPFHCLCWSNRQLRAHLSFLHFTCDISLFVFQEFSAGTFFNHWWSGQRAKLYISPPLQPQNSLPLALPHDRPDGASSLSQLSLSSGLSSDLLQRRKGNNPHHLGRRGKGTDIYRVQYHLRVSTGENCRPQRSNAKRWMFKTKGKRDSVMLRNEMFVSHYFNWQLQKINRPIVYTLHTLGAQRFERIWVSEVNLNLNIHRRFWEFKQFNIKMLLYFAQCIGVIY